MADKEVRYVIYVNYVDNKEQPICHGKTSLGMLKYISVTGRFK